MTYTARVLAALRTAGGPVGTPAITAATGLSRGAVWVELLRLERVGVVCRLRRRAGGQPLGARLARRWAFVRRVSYATSLETLA